MPEIVI